MPAIEIMHQYQSAVLWALSGVDRYGQNIVAAPVEIKVRWVIDRRESRDAKGNPIQLDATVDSAQRIIPGSSMWLGTLAAWNAGVTNPEVMEVVNYKETPDIYNRAVKYTSSLVKYKGAIPALA